MLGAEAWRWMGLGAAGASVGILLANRWRLFDLWVGRYTDYLSRRSRRLFVRIPARAVALGQVVAVVTVTLLGIAGLWRFWYVFVAALSVAPVILIERRLRDRIMTIGEQAAGFALALANSLKSTASVGAALDTAANLVDGPIAEEMRLAVKETRVGRSLDEAVQAVGPRVGSDKLAVVVAAVLIGRQLGGNLGKILETTAATLREMARLEGVVRQKTAEGRMQLWAMSLGPILICVGLHKMDPNFFEPLTTTVTGKIASVVAALAYCAGIVSARKIMAVDL